MDEEGFDIYGDDLTGGADSKAADNEDDLLYGDLSDAGAAASGKEAQTEAQDQDKGEGAGEEDLELNLYEVGDKEDEDDSRSSGGRRGLERERYPAGGDRPQQNKEGGPPYAVGPQHGYAGARAPPGQYGQRPPQQYPGSGAGGAPQPQTATGPQDVPALYIGNLTWWTTDQDLEDVCSQFGKVKQVKFFENKQNGRSKGYALVEYYDAEASRQAKEKLQGYTIHDKQVMVNFVSPQTLAELNNPGKKGGPSLPPMMGGGRPPMQRSSGPNAPPSSQPRGPPMGGRGYPPGPGGRGFMPGPYGPDGPMPPGMPGAVPFVRFPGGMVPGIGRGGAGGRGIMGHSPYGPDFFPMMPVPGAHLNPAFFKDHPDDMYRGGGRDDRDYHDRDRERDRERDRGDRDRDRERERPAAGESSRSSSDSSRPADRERDVRDRDREREPERDRDRERERERERDRDRERERERERERGRSSSSSSRSSRRSSERGGDDRGVKREREESRTSESSSSSRSTRDKDDDRKRRRDDSSESSGRHERR